MAYLMANDGKGYIEERTLVGQIEGYISLLRFVKNNIDDLNKKSQAAQIFNEQNKYFHYEGEIETLQEVAGYLKRASNALVKNYENAQRCDSKGEVIANVTSKEKDL